MAITGQVSRYTRIPELPARAGAFSSFPSTLDPWPGTYVSGAPASPTPQRPQGAQLTLFTMTILSHWNTCVNHMDAPFLGVVGIS